MTKCYPNVANCVDYVMIICVFVLLMGSVEFFLAFILYTEVVTFYIEINQGVSWVPGKRLANSLNFL